MQSMVHWIIGKLYEKRCCIHSMKRMSVQWFVGSKESCVQKIKELTQESKKGYAF